MNRRTFFSRIGCAVVGCYLAVSIPRLGVSKLVPKIIYRMNPEWVNARYELAFVRHHQERTVGHEFMMGYQPIVRHGFDTYAFTSARKQTEKFGFSRFNEIPKGPPETWKPINQFISEVV